MKSALGPSAPTSFFAQSTLPLYTLTPPLPSICKRVFTTSIGIVTAQRHSGALGTAARVGVGGRAVHSSQPRRRRSRRTRALSICCPTACLAELRDAIEACRRARLCYLPLFIGVNDGTSALACRHQGKGRRRWEALAGRPAQAIRNGHLREMAAADDATEATAAMETNDAEEPEEENIFFVEAEEVLGLITSFSDPEKTAAAHAAAAERVAHVLDRYQEQPTVLDPQLEAMVVPLLEAVRTVARDGASRELLPHTCRVMYTLCKVRDLPDRTLALPQPQP